MIEIKIEDELGLGTVLTYCLWTSLLEIQMVRLLAAINDLFSF